MRLLSGSFADELVIPLIISTFVDSYVRGREPAPGTGVREPEARRMSKLLYSAGVGDIEYTDYAPS